MGTASDDDTVLLKPDASPPISLALLLAADCWAVDEVAADRSEEMVRKGGGPPLVVVVVVLAPPDPIEVVLAGGGGDVDDWEMEMVGR